MSDIRGVFLLELFDAGAGCGGVRFVVIGCGGGGGGGGGAEEGEIVIIRSVFEIGLRSGRLGF